MYSDYTFIYIYLVKIHYDLSYQAACKFSPAIKNAIYNEYAFILKGLLILTNS